MQRHYPAGGAVTAPCLFCDRDCPACGWPIDGGWEHLTGRQPQTGPDAGALVVCKVRRVIRPLAETLELFFGHHSHRSGVAS